MIKKLNEEIIKSMKSKDSFRKDVLKMLKSLIEEESKKKSDKQSDSDVVIGYHKKLEKSLYIKNIPQDFIDKTTKELEIIKEFMPSEFSTQEIRNLILAFIDENGYIGPVGEMMGFLKKKAKATGKILNSRKAIVLINKQLKCEKG